MRRSLAALAVAVAAATLAVGCGGGGDDDDEAGDGPTTTATTVREAVDVSTPEAVVAALADAGITCDNLVSEGSDGLAFFDIEGTESNCTIGGDRLSIASWRPTTSCRTCTRCSPNWSASSPTRTASRSARSCGSRWSTRS